MKKNILMAMFVVSTFTTFAQTLNYNDLGVLFSKNNNFGTARFEAMSGAFGALGGDLSSININPAGMAVATRGGASISLGVRTVSTDTEFYGNKANSRNEYFNFAQGGGALVLTSSNESTKWNRYAVTFNYSKKADFGGEFQGEHKKEIDAKPYFNSMENLSDEDKEYYEDFDRSVYQGVSAVTEGSSGVFNVGFSASYDDKLQLGGSLNFHNFNLIDRTVFSEEVDDVDGNILFTDYKPESYIEGNGFSLGLGFIYRLEGLRLGLAYETPTWYAEIVEEFQDDFNITPKDDNLDYVDWRPEIEAAVYSFKSPSKLTASGAYVFGKQGLISVDYTLMNYKNMKYRNADDILSKANGIFNENYQPSHSVNLGTEWRIEAVSLRGGYHFAQSPHKSSDNIQGFSLGAGYNFGRTKLGLSYRNSSEVNKYNVYNTSGIDTDSNTSRITATLTYGL